jgi:citryl-CoA synthetase large subunit
MKLYEYEGKQLLKEAGIKVPEGYLVKDGDEIRDVEKGVYIKAQTMAGSRAKSGFVVASSSKDDASFKVKQMLQKKHKGETIKKLLIETKLQVKHEYYLSILYNTKTRKPTIIVSKEGGIEIENNKNKVIEEINFLEPFTIKQATSIANKAKVPQLTPLIKQCYDLFLNKDMKLLEINPVIEVEYKSFTNEGSRKDLFAADAVIILDDDAFFRQNHPFPQRIGTGREKTEREIAANKISNSDHKGIAGKTFIDLDGDIAILASGGGASITAVDALLSYNAKPANYTEYSGNPSAEKVEALTRLVLDIPNLNGLFIVGAKANFTNIKETIAAIVKVIKEKQITYPIVIRRDGPYADEAKALVEEAKQEGYNIEWYGQETPITVAAKRISEKVKEFKEKKDSQ